MAVTHADLAPSRRSCDLGSKTGAFLMVLSILLGLFSFLLCLISEISRSQMIWQASSGEEKGMKSECTYSSSGKIPLLSATGAFFALAMAMVIQHTYLLVAVSKSDSLITWHPDSDFAKSLEWQAGFFFVVTWVCFAVGEILLLIGISVESRHLKNWQMPRESCLIIRQGLFTVAGVFGLLTVFLASGLFITALRTQMHAQDQENMRREILETSVLYASPPRSPRRIQAVPNENTTSRQDQNMCESSNYTTMFLEEHNVLRSPRSGFCVYDTRGLAQNQMNDGLEDVSTWMSTGVRHNQPCYRPGDEIGGSMELSNSRYVKRKVNCVMVVADLSEIHKAFKCGDLKPVEALRDLFHLPSIKKCNENPILILTHGDTLNAEDRINGRLKICEYLGIPETTGAYDIPCLTEQGILPEESDPATSFAMTEAICRALLQSDRTFTPKKKFKDWIVLIFSWIMWFLASFFAILAHFFSKFGPHQDKLKL